MAPEIKVPLQMRRKDLHFTKAALFFMNPLVYFTTDIIMAAKHSQNRTLILFQATFYVAHKKSAGALQAGTFK